MAFKGKDFDRELKKHGVTLDRAKPTPKGRELDAEALGDDDASKRKGKGKGK
jgi:hypothetical protein